MRWVSGLLRRRPARILGGVLAIGLTVAFLASLGAFFSSSKARMTQEAAAGVPVDWQLQLQAGTSVRRARRMVRATSGVRRIEPVEFANTPGLRSSSGGAVQTTGSGKVLGLPHGYARAFPGELRFLVGARSGVLIAQQAAANLHATIGSVVEVEREGLPPVRVRVQGIVDLPQADSLFQVVGLPPGSGLTAPPDNVVLLPASTWNRYFGGRAAVRPGATYEQLHVALDPATLPPDPSAAFAQVLTSAHNLEARLAGGGTVGDNLGAQLDASRSDSLYAQLLFLFLGVPGAILAALLAGVIGSAARDRRRQEQALLRIRGATPKRIARLAAAEALFVGVAGSAIGLGGATLAGRLAFGTWRFGPNTAQAAAWAGGAAGKQ